MCVEGKLLMGTLQLTPIKVKEISPSLHLWVVKLEISKLWYIVENIRPSN